MNIILIGMPGSGKTTLGKKLATQLGMKFLDFDDDILESGNNPRIPEVLALRGDEGFLDYEQEHTLKLDFQNTVLSCSGSQPLRPRAMQYLRQIGLVVWIDIPVDIIETRLHKMKVERIVGMGKMTLGEILNYRKQFYIDGHELRFSYNIQGDIEHMWQKFLEFLTPHLEVKQ